MSDGLVWHGISAPHDFGNLCRSALQLPLFFSISLARNDTYEMPVHQCGLIDFWKEVSSVGHRCQRGEPCFLHALWWHDVLCFLSPGSGPTENVPSSLRERCCMIFVKIF